MSMSMLKEKKLQPSRHAHDIAMNRKIKQMTSKIQDLGARLEASISHLVNQTKDDHHRDKDQKHDVKVEQEKVTTCFIPNCFSNLLQVSEEELGEADDDKMTPEVKRLSSPTQTFYKHPLPESPYLQALIPKSREEWLDFLVWLVKQRVVFKYLTDVKLKRVIEIARGQIGRRDPVPEIDPNIPSCYYWNEEEVANWIQEIGFPHLRGAFLKNFMNGRRLLGLDASALNKMGIQNWEEIKELAMNIRNIFDLTPPNEMRPILRIPPYETFLKKFRIQNGNTYDQFTFQKFCRKYNYDYEELVTSKNLNALIPCTCTILIRTDNDNLDNDSLASDDSFDSDSLIDAPSVEFQVRHQFIRDQAVENIINDLIEMTFVKPTTTEKSVHGLTYIDDLIENILNGTLLDLGFGDPTLYTAEQVKFAAQIALALLSEIQNTTQVMSDINHLKTHIKMEPQLVETMKGVTEFFIEDLTPIAALLALNQLTLEVIFRHQPQFESFVDGIVTSAEGFVQSVLSEAQIEIMARNHINYSSLRSVRSASHLTAQIIDDLLTQTVKLAQDASKPISQPQQQNYEHIILPVHIENIPIEGALKTLWENEVKKETDDLNMKKSDGGDLEEMRKKNTDGRGDAGGTQMTDLELTTKNLTLNSKEISSINRINHNYINQKKISQCGKTFFHRMKSSPRSKLNKKIELITSEMICHRKSSQLMQQRRPQSAPQQMPERNKKKVNEKMSRSNTVTGSVKKSQRRKQSIDRPKTARDIWKELKKLSFQTHSTPPVSPEPIINDDLQDDLRFKQTTQAGRPFPNSSPLNNVNLIRSTSLEILNEIFTHSLKHTMNMENEKKLEEKSTPSGLGEGGGDESEQRSPSLMSINTSAPVNYPKVLKQKIRKKVVGSLRKAMDNASIGPVAVVGVSEDDHFQMTITPPGSVASTSESEDEIVNDVKNNS